MSYKFLILVLILASGRLLHAQEKPQTFTAQGISIEFSATPNRAGATSVVAGEEMTIRFKITGISGGVPLSNLRPVAWVDQRQTKEPIEARVCREKVQSFLQPSFSSRPTADLNTY